MAARAATSSRLPCPPTPHGLPPAPCPPTPLAHTSESGDHGLPEHNGGSPGSCAYGPDVSFVGVRFRRGARLCERWLYQPAPVVPPNLYLAQLWRRQQPRLERDGGGGGGGGKRGGGKED